MWFGFARPWFLIAFLLAPILWLGLQYTLTDFTRKQKLLMLVVRASIVALLILALAQIRWVGSSDRITHIFLIDVSGSISAKNLNRAHSIVNAAWKEKGNDELRIITFASEPRLVDLPPSSRSVPELIPAIGENARVTDLQAALRLAYSLSPENSIRRITIISDGNETRGQALLEARRAGSGPDSHTRIYAISQEVEPGKEVAIGSLKLPSHTKVNETFTAVAELFSTQPTVAQLTLLRDGETVGTQVAQLQAGKNRVEFKTQVDKAGSALYEIKCNAVDDTVAENNHAIAATIAEGKPRVLYLEGRSESARYLVDALRREQIEVDLRNRASVPHTLQELEGYDLVILSDIPASALSQAQMLALESYVDDTGGSVILAGGSESFGIGGYNDTPVEKLSPVSFEPEKKEIPSLALVLVIDKSGSMAGRKMELTKDAAVAAVNVISERDLVGVLEFDHTWEWASPLKPPHNKQEIRNLISGIQASGGTNIYSALEEAFNVLTKTKARTKHIILLTDGRSQAGDYKALLEKISREFITVSTVAVGAGADRELLDNISSWGRGRSYFTEEADDLPQIFVQEAKRSSKPTSLIEEGTRLKVSKTAEVISGIDFNQAPRLLGYNETRPKPTSEVLLISQRGDPILARWRYGLGKVVAFTSDTKNHWAVEWIGWSGYKKFWTQLVRDTMCHSRADGLNVSVSSLNQQGRIVVDAANKQGDFLTNINLTATVIDPLQQQRSIHIEQVSPGRYEAEFRMQVEGGYRVMINRMENGAATPVTADALATSYSDEYAHLSANRVLLERLCRMTGGRLNPTVDEILKHDGEQAIVVRDLWPTLLSIALGLFLLDIFLRRVRLFEESAVAD